MHAECSKTHGWEGTISMTMSHARGTAGYCLLGACGPHLRAKVRHVLISGTYSICVLIQIFSSE